MWATCILNFYSRGNRSVPKISHQFIYSQELANSFDQLFENLTTSHIIDELNRLVSFQLEIKFETSNSSNFQLQPLQKFFRSAWKQIQRKINLWWLPTIFWQC